MQKRSDLSKQEVLYGSNSASLLCSSNSKNSLKSILEATV